MLLYERWCARLTAIFLSSVVWLVYPLLTYTVFLISALVSYVLTSSFRVRSKSFSNIVLIWLAKHFVWCQIRIYSLRPRACFFGYAPIENWLICFTDKHSLQGCFSLRILTTHKSERLIIRMDKGRLFRAQVVLHGCVNIYRNRLQLPKLILRQSLSLDSWVIHSCVRHSC